MTQSAVAVMTMVSLCGADGAEAQTSDEEPRSGSNSQLLRDRGRTGRWGRTGANSAIPHPMVSGLLYVLKHRLRGTLRRDMTPPHRREA